MPNWDVVVHEAKILLSQYKEMQWADIRNLPPKIVPETSIEGYEMSIHHFGMMNGTSEIKVLASKPMAFGIFYRQYMCAFEIEESGHIQDVFDGFKFESKKARRERLAWDALGDD